MMDFHVHIDAAKMTPELERYLLETNGFWRSDFSGHPDGVAHDEPVNHLTYKAKGTRDYKRVLHGVLAYVESNKAMEGYVEGELVAQDVDIEARPYDSSVDLPFKLHTRFLPPNTFRETEIHIIVDPGIETVV